MSAGPPPDRFLIGLAVLSLLSDVAEEQPLMCLVDDQQWLDRASAQILAFVARRLGAESVGLVFAARVPSSDLAGLPELVVEGLRDGDARVLLDSALTGPIDGRVRDQIVAETRGNPLALLELPRGLTPAELAGGFGLPGAVPLTGRIEQSVRRQLDALPAGTRRLIQVAAADPVGDPVLVWRAAERLGIGAGAATPAAEAGLAEFGAQVRFRHPLVRTLAYQSASLQDRQEAHRALAEVTDPQVDPDRRAWHQAQAAPGLDEDVAAELERSAGRAQARGGIAAAAAFLERAALLTCEPGHRAQRLLAAAQTKHDAGALNAALELLVAVEAGPPDRLRAAEVEHLRGQIALDQRHGSVAARLLLSAARRLEPLDPGLARETHLEALVGGGDVGRRPGQRRWPAGGGRGRARRAARSRPAAAGRCPAGRAGAALHAGTRGGRGGPGPGAGTDPRPGCRHRRGRPVAPAVSGRISQIIAVELWDFESWHALATRQARLARGAGALVHLQFALNYLARTHLLGGELATASEMIEEDHLIAEATRNPPVSDTEIMLAAWRGREPAASELIEATTAEATARDEGRLAGFAAYASSVLYNGLGRLTPRATPPGGRSTRGQLGHGPLVVSELAEAAARTGDVPAASAALEWLSERTRVLPTEWALGIEARIRALLSEGEDADRRYRESIARLSRTRLRAELARGHLLYGEWLRRERRRTDAREQLRMAHGMLEAMGIEAFAERAGRELRATGETVRKRSLPARHEELTAQEAQIARLARDGLSNPEIGTRLFISAHTVQYHLRKVFTKLGITSRSQLNRVLPSDPATA